MGVEGASMLAVVLVAGAYGARASTGILLPMMMTADLFAIFVYRRNVDRPALVRLLQWTVLGVLIATFTGAFIDERVFTILLFVTIVSGLILVVAGEFGARPVPPEHWAFAAFIGTIAGFATMIANAASPIVAIYLLAMGYTRDRFIGTGAWFYLIINVIKLPGHIFIWRTIDVESLALSAVGVPAIVIGVVVGRFLVRLIPQRAYRYIVVAAVVISTIRMGLSLI
jgi:hypothetical protein